MRVIFHVGYQKTASNYLQREIFPRIPQVTFSKGNKEFSEILYENILKKDSLSYSNEIENIKTLFCDIKSNYKTILVSEEVMAGDILEPNILTPKDVCDRLLHIKSISNKNDFKIIIIVRNQSSLIYSAYKEYLKLGGGGGVKEFLYKENNSKFFDYLYFDNLIKYYQNSFGCDNVIVQFYEHMTLERNVFFLEMLTFIFKDTFVGIDELVAKLNKKNTYINKGISSKIFWIIRLINKISKSGRNPGGLIPHMDFIRSIILKIGKAIAKNESDTVIPFEIIKFTARYEKSNENLQALMSNKSRDLKELGYPV
jgi:hypothetical protein